MTGHEWRETSFENQLWLGEKCQSCDLERFTSRATGETKFYLCDAPTRELTCAEARGE